MKNLEKYIIQIILIIYILIFIYIKNIRENYYIKCLLEDNKINNYDED